MIERWTYVTIKDWNDWKTCVFFMRDNENTGIIFTSFRNSNKLYDLVLSLQSHSIPCMIRIKNNYTAEDADIWTDLYFIMKIRNPKYNTRNKPATAERQIAAVTTPENLFRVSLLWSVCCSEIWDLKIFVSVKIQAHCHEMREWIYRKKYID